MIQQNVNNWSVSTSEILVCAPWPPGGSLIHTDVLRFDNETQKTTLATKHAVTIVALLQRIKNICRWVLVYRLSPCVVAAYVEYRSCLKVDNNHNINASFASCFAICASIKLADFHKTMLTCVGWIQISEFSFVRFSFTVTLKREWHQIAWSKQMATFWKNCSLSAW